MKIAASRGCACPDGDAPSLPPPPTTARGQRTALIVDDDAAIRRALSVILQSIGFETTAVSNGFDALTRMHETSEFTVVLLDLRMPVMDGSETYRELRRLWPKTPVIIVSGHHPHEVGLRLDGPMPDGFVQKPFSFSSLTAAVHQTLTAATAHR